MAKSNIIKSLEELDKKDIYSLILFVLYKLKDNPEYSTLSELIYILDNDSFIRFLNYFGGQTIAVPTVSDMKEVLSAICYYERKINTDLTDKEIFDYLNIPEKQQPEVLRISKLIVDILDKYDFKR